MSHGMLLRAIGIFEKSIMSKSPQYCVEENKDGGMAEANKKPANKQRKTDRTELFKCLYGKHIYLYTILLFTSVHEKKTNNTNETTNTLELRVSCLAC